MSKIKDKIREIFGIDYRSLAIFRVGLALLILFDLYVRSKALVAHYTDYGVLPRVELISRFTPPMQFSLHNISGEPFFQAILFLIAFIFALALLFGYKTRVVMVISWILLISLHSRNQFVLQGGDILLRMLAFWAMFLPLGGKYSIDSIGKKKKEGNYLSFGTLGIYLQIASLYVFSAMFKSGKEWFPEGSAIYYALSIDQFVTPIGSFLLGIPFLLKPMTYFVYFFEYLGPFFLFFPLFFGPFRTMMTFAFIGLHAAMGSSLYLGPFPWIGSLGFLVFLPSWFWNKLEMITRREEAKNLKIYYDADCGFCERSVNFIRTFLILPENSVLPAQKNALIYKEMNEKNSWVITDGKGRKYFKSNALAPIFSASSIFWSFSFIFSISLINKIGDKIYDIIAKRRSSSCKIIKKEERKRENKVGVWILNALAIFFIVYIMLWNFYTLGYKVITPEQERVAHLFRIDQKWNMFSPFPLKEDGWYVIAAKLENDKKIDLVRKGKAIDWDKPKNVALLYEHERWRKYMMNLWDRENAYQRTLYSRYLCIKWNKEHSGDDRLKEFNIYYMKELTLPDYKKPKVEKVLIHEWKCY
ncbi:MAG: DCC1-like thiol-disulfide oxidoreductase family protein [Nanoarchaeota archaeon]